MTAFRGIGDFLALLNGVQTKGNNHWMALCPAHQDKDQSLSVTANDKAIAMETI